MSEAYEIGVTLALSDGVSDGIGRARREIAALQRVLTNSGVPIAHLRKTAIEASPPAKQGFEQRYADRKLPSPSAATLPSSQQFGDRALVATRAPSAVSTDGNTHNIGAYEVNNRDQWAENKPSHLEATQPIVRPSTGPQTASAPSDLRSREAAEGPVPAVGRQVDTLGESVLGRTFGAAPLDTLLSSKQEPHRTDIANTQRATFANEWSPGNSEGASRIPSGVTYRQAAAPAVRNSNQSKSSAGFQPSDWPLVRMPSAPHAMEDKEESGRPEQPAQPRIVAPTVFSGPVAAAAGAPDKSASRPAEGAQGPIEGDVYLDGMLVGRWMSRYLAQEAGRASAGPTGFDGRRGWLLPGATVGT